MNTIFEQREWHNNLLSLNKVLIILAMFISFLPCAFFTLAGLYCLAFAHNKINSICMVLIGVIPYLIWIFSLTSSEKLKGKNKIYLYQIVLLLISSILAGIVLIGFCHIFFN